MQDFFRGGVLAFNFIVHLLGLLGAQILTNLLSFLYTLKWLLPKLFRWVPFNIVRQDTIQFMPLPLQFLKSINFQHD